MSIKPDHINEFRQPLKLLYTRAAQTAPIANQLEGLMLDGVNHEILVDGYFSDGLLGQYVLEFAWYLPEV